jgi:alpha-galactosidase
MTKITFMGAGSTVFAKSVLGDSLLTPALQECQIALYDIDAERLNDSRLVIENINATYNKGRAKVTTHLGPSHRRAALQGATFAVNAIQVGGYEPSTVIDFEIPKKYGLRQTIADTLGIGGIFRALRTIPVMLDFARDMEAVCPDVWLLNYSNPMAMLTGAMLRGTAVKTVGLCHSVQACAQEILADVGMEDLLPHVWQKVAGINHMGWLLELKDARTGEDLYPEVKRRAAGILDDMQRQGGAFNVMRERKALMEKKGESPEKDPLYRASTDAVRMRMMLVTGYYITESSEHSAEYAPYWIKGRYPELIEQYNIPLDEYPRRCVEQIKGWKRQREEIVNAKSLTHSRTSEFASYIMEAIVTGNPAQIGGNVLNRGVIPNLPGQACVEVPCLVDRGGVQPTYVGDLPEICAALNRTNINVQLLAIEAALTGKRDAIYHAAMMDPHTAAELSLDDIRAMCDDLIEAHGPFLPQYR